MDKQFPDPTDRLFRRHPDMVFGRIDDEVVMMSIETGEYYGLNSVATRIWELLETPRSFEQLIDLLTHEFDIDEEACREDVQKFLKQLIRKKLVLSD